MHFLHAVFSVGVHIPVWPNIVCHVRLAYSAANFFCSYALRSRYVEMKVRISVPHGH